MEYKEEKGGKQGETTLFLYSWSVHPNYLSNYYFKEIFFTVWDATKQIAAKQNSFF